MADQDQEKGIFADPTPKEKGFFGDDPKPEQKPERGVFDDEPRKEGDQERGIFADDPAGKREEEKPRQVDQDKDRVTVEVKQPEERPEGWKAETLEREENQVLREQQGPEAVQRYGSDVLPNPDGWKGGGTDLRTPEEMAAGVQLEPDEYTRRSSSEFYTAQMEGDRAGGPSKDREIYDLPDLKDRDGFTPGPDRDGFTQGEPAQNIMTGAEIKEMVEKVIDERRQQEKDQFKELDAARASGADPQTIEAMKAQVKETIGDRLTAENLSQSITPDMMNQGFNVGEIKQDLKENMQKVQNAVQNYRDTHPGQGIHVQIKEDPELSR